MLFKPAASKVTEIAMEMSTVEMEEDVGLLVCKGLICFDLCIKCQERGHVTFSLLAHIGNGIQISKSFNQITIRLRIILICAEFNDGVLALPVLGGTQVRTDRLPDILKIEIKE